VLERHVFGQSVHVIVHSPLLCVAVAVCVFLFKSEATELSWVAQWQQKERVNPQQMGDRARQRERQSKREKQHSLARLLLQCVDSIAEWKTSKLQSAVTKTVVLSFQPASKDFLNYQKCTGRAALCLICQSSKETKTMFLFIKGDHRHGANTVVISQSEWYNSDMIQSMLRILSSWAIRSGRGYIIVWISWILISILFLLFPPIHPNDST